MTEQDIEKLIKEQNKYFNSGLTRSYESRLVSLKALKRAITNRTSKEPKAPKTTAKDIKTNTTKTINLKNTNKK